MNNTLPYFPMVQVLRNDFLESLHFGSAIVIGRDKTPLIEFGDVDRQIFPRSAIKMIQAIPLLESGAASYHRLPPQYLALACSSHQGSPMHTKSLKKWLIEIGLTVNDLKCGVQPPFDKEERQKLRDTGSKPSQLHNNCSGKHIGFLTYSKYHRMDLDYTHSDHPLQRKIQTVLEELSGESICNFGIDGCSAPNFMCSLRGLASAMYNLTEPKRLGTTRSKSVEAILQGMQNYPLLVAGEGRACSELMMAARTPIIIKTGAEGVFVAVLPKNRIGVALKIVDGSTRAAEAAIALILVRLGVLSEDHPTVRKRLFCEIRNWDGRLTGKISPTDLFWDSGKKFI